ncbi:hypothetical protein HPB50_018120 [Hyalomma asiaticum]|uniref:Uncharacterized protein n=1 Tax=Hyalomma asiaticum TaxID=266040 RepID=A0ACB7TIB0_HYAAI|nr:hypothetical protein HPB50_018120 [Hyalomma asiaticum]
MYARVQSLRAAVVLQARNGGALDHANHAEAVTRHRRQPPADERLRGSRSYLSGQFTDTGRSEPRVVKVAQRPRAQMVGRTSPLTSPLGEERQCPALDVQLQSPRSDAGVPLSRRARDEERIRRRRAPPALKAAHFKVAGLHRVSDVAVVVMQLPPAPISPYLSTFSVFLHTQRPHMFPENQSFQRFVLDVRRIIREEPAATLDSWCFPDGRLPCWLMAHQCPLNKLLVLYEIEIVEDTAWILLIASCRQ